MLNEIVDAVLEEMRDRNIQRSLLSNARRREMLGECPEIREIDIQIAREAYAHADVAGLVAKRNKAVKKWLDSKKLPPDYLEPVPACASCGDSGSIGGRLCTCVRNEVARRMFADAGLSDGGPSFERFDLSIFPADAATRNGVSVRDFMQGLRENSIVYSDKFPALKKPNMLFTGRPGLGKTYLMDCIAARVIARGFWVVRATAFHVNDVMAKALVERADPDSLYECDLLVLDDMGTEPVLNKVTISSFFNLFNERNAKGKPFILSTNLPLEGLLQRYGDRIFSRITDQRLTQVIEFEGVDLRH